MHSSKILAFGISAIIWSGTSQAEPAASAHARLLSFKDRVVQATVTLPERSCAGAVAGDRSHVVTAAHCIPEQVERVRVRFSTGGSQRAAVKYIDRDADLALLRLDSPASVEALELADALPQRYAPVLFVGRTDRASRTQVARVDRLGRCPSLPGQPAALFTNLVARPGDSGAPLVDSEARVVAVIHGGASCHIAAPTVALVPLLAQPAKLDRLEQRPFPAPRDDGWSFERTPDGFRFRWNFRWSFGS
jgi:S1-C subfamily serine protease